METALTEDALLGGRVRLLQSRRGYRVAVDAVLLAAAVHPGPGERVLDLGAGVGAVGLCIAKRVPDCTIVGVELQSALAQLAQRNAARNGFGDRVRTLVHDIARPLPAELGQFEQVVTNPPYMAAAAADPPPDRSKALATVESSADLGRWLEVAAGALKSAGTLTLIHRTDRLEETAAHLVRLGCGALTIKRLPPAPRVLVRARRGPPSVGESPPLVLHKPDGGYTEAAEAILRHAAALDF
ncbi:MAG: methyltransferase [Proteobacteria bacterium]|nr:methyltransferase [Pseudomonadota bacterium]